MTHGLNINRADISNLTTSGERNEFTVSIKTTDPTTAQVIHTRISQLITNLGDTAEIQVEWARMQTKMLDNHVF